MVCSRPLRVALFWPTFAGGGIERTGIRIAQALVERGHQVSIVVASSVGELRSVRIDGVRLVDLGITVGRGRFLLSALPLARYLRREEPEVLWSHSTQANIVSLLAAIFSWFRGWQIISEHTTLSMRLHRGIRKCIFPPLMRLLYRRANRIHAVSNGVAEDLAQFANIAIDRVNVIPNPVIDTSLLAKADETLEHPWFQPGQPPVVLGVGRLAIPKDFATLIRAFAKVRSKIQARLLILGEGPCRTELEALVTSLGLEHDVSLPGFSQNPYNFMKHAAALVLSSRWEGLPTVLIEAMALGVPIVSTDCPNGPREILEGGRWGELVPVGDVDTLSEAILRSITAPDKARIVGAQERSREYEVQRVLQMHLERLFPCANEATR